MLSVQNATQRQTPKTVIQIKLLSFIISKRFWRQVLPVLHTAFLCFCRLCTNWCQVRISQHLWEMFPE